jgi:streptogrisin C
MNHKRMARLAGMALAAAGLAVSFASPVTASSEAMAPEMLAAMQRDLGLSAEQVYARVAQENAATTAEIALRDRLGGSFAGAWFDRSAGKLVVAVTDSSKVSQVSSAGATARVVQRTAAQLDAQVAKLDAQAAAAPSSVTGWYVDAPSNSVVATVVNSDPAGLAWVSKMGARSESTSAAPQTYGNLIGGMAITTSAGSRCSLGFNARSGSSRYVITAGHCTNIGGTWSGAGATIGRSAGSSFPGNDYGIILVSTAASVTTPLVDRYSAGADATVAGSTQASVGSTICRSGSTTGYRCGTIGAHNQTVRYPQGTVTGLTRTSACAQPGDSGGSFVSPNSTRVQAQGVTSGGSGNCTTGGTTFHQPVNEVLSRFGLTLATG